MKRVMWRPRLNVTISTTHLMHTEYGLSGRPLDVQLWGYIIHTIVNRRAVHNDMFFTHCNRFRSPIISPPLVIKFWSEIREWFFFFLFLWWWWNLCYQPAEIVKKNEKENDPLLKMYWKKRATWNAKRTRVCVCRRTARARTRNGDEQMASGFLHGLRSHFANSDREIKN